MLLLWNVQYLHFIFYSSIFVLSSSKRGRLLDLNVLEFWFWWCKTNRKIGLILFKFRRISVLRSKSDTNVKSRQCANNIRASRVQEQPNAFHLGLSSRSLLPETTNKSLQRFIWDPGGAGNEVPWRWFDPRVGWRSFLHGNEIYTPNPNLKRVWPNSSS